MNYRDLELSSACTKAVPEGFDLIWDTSGHHDGRFLAEVSAPGARILLTAAADANTGLPLGRLYTKDVSLIGFVMSRASAAQLARAAKGLMVFLERKRLRAAITEVLDLSEAARAHQMMESGELRGRVVLTP